MGFKEKKYGVTWNTTRSKNPTTMWFDTPHNREKFIRDLIKNPIVYNHTIFPHNKNVDDD